MTKSFGEFSSRIGSHGTMPHLTVMQRQFDLADAGMAHRVDAPEATAPVPSRPAQVGFEKAMLGTKEILVYRYE